MKVGITFFSREGDKIIAHDLGHVSIDESLYKSDEHIADRCWHLCNWACWTDTKPEELDSTLSVCNSDVAFEIRGTYWMALTVGWEERDSIESIVTNPPKYSFIHRLR